MSNYNESRFIFNEEVLDDKDIQNIDKLKEGKQCWKNTALMLEVTGKALVALSGVTSFIATYLDDRFISLSAGLVSTVSFAILYFGSFGYSEANRRIAELNYVRRHISELNKNIVLKDKEEKVNLLIDSSLVKLREKIKERISRKSSAWTLEDIENFIENADLDELEEFQKIAEETSIAIENEKKFISKYNSEL